ncbi:MAG: ParB/RepB/Spo0J family partition protein [Proteobacteria bacterium]|nr:ParB/RepB/Spo0J family partition protein [Pseudomonadota bacterium]
MATITQRGLGKGLSALIGENYSATAAAPQAKDAKEKEAPAKAAKTKAEPGIEVAEAAAGGVYTLAVSKLHPGKYQPRTQFSDEAISELAESIRKNGIMQPIIVRVSGRTEGKYEIVAGERRWRAAQKAALEQVPVIIRDIPDKQALELALVENIQRQDLSPIEEAMGYQRLIEEFEYTQEELSGVIGKSRSHIANLLRLLSLPEEIRDMMERSELTMGHARALIGVPGAADMAKEVVKRGLNVRQVEQLVRERQGVEKRSVSRNTTKAPGTAYVPPAIGGKKDPDIVALEESLSENLGLRVSIEDRGQSGEIVIAYDSLSQLDSILRRLGDSI